MLVSSGQIEFAPVLAELYRQCFPDKWSAQEIQKILGLPSTIGWITEKGFLICAHVLDEIEIITIGVLPKYRRMHVGSALINDLIEYAKDKKVKKIFLEVSVLNTPAQGLYARFGFKQMGIRKAYYQTENGSVDALCLVKEL